MPSPDVSIASVGSDLISGPDAEALVHLLGEIIASGKDKTEGRDMLMQNLCDLIGADGWSISRSNASDARTDHLVGFARPDGNNRVLSISLFRSPEKPCFTPREKRLALILLEEQEWLYHTDSKKTKKATDLTPREVEIFRLARSGLDRKSMAARLGLSPHTIAGHLQSLYRKMDVTTHIELMNRPSSSHE